MKLIIDIPKEYYKAITETPNHQCTADTLIIKNGTLLPKGHGDLIDRDQILQGEHFMILGDVSVGDKNFGEQEIDMFPKQTIMNVKPIIEADKGE